MPGRGLKISIAAGEILPNGPRSGDEPQSEGDAETAGGDRKRTGGLVLTRRVGQSIMIGESIEVEVMGLKSGTARLRIAAPREVPVHRCEVYDAIRADPRPVVHPLSIESPGPAGPGRSRTGPPGLVLTRHPGESIMIGDLIAVEVVDVRPSVVRLRVAAPREVSVHRREIFDAIHSSVRDRD